MPDTKKTVLEEAIEAVDDRGETYGHPRDHFARTTGMINALFTQRVTERIVTGQPMFEPEDWAYIMICDKLARQQGAKKHRDNLIDVCGYVRTAEKIDEPRPAVASDLLPLQDAIDATAERELLEKHGLIVAKHNPEGMPVLVVSDEVPD